MKENILEQLFTYHPPKNEEEKNFHEIVNHASMEYAFALSSIIRNPAELTTILRKIQEVRMLANSAVCYDRIG